MKQFCDKTGRSWTISLTLRTAIEVRDKLGVDLLQPEQGSPPLLTRLGTDEIMLGEVICALLGDQFEKHGVTAAQVRGSFDGSTLLAAQKAFYEELVDFFQSRGRTDRARAVLAQMQVIEAAIRAAETRIEAIDIERTIEEAERRLEETIRGGTFGSPPEASELIQEA